jgi:hypothetical protein
MSTKLTNVRLSFPDLFTAKSFQEGGEPKYRASFLIPKDDPQIALIEADIKKVAEAKWGKKADSILKSIRGNANKFCFQDGDTKDYDGYEGNMSVSANNKARPLVIDGQKNPLTAADGKPYAGCYVNCSIEFFAYDKPANGISAGLKGVQFVKDGDAFGGGAPASPDEFDDLGVEETADDLAG